jgi:flavin reductase (DIM6/NTAB) family NADH-FMN oxidoreductase RutF
MFMEGWSGLVSTEDRRLRDCLGQFASGVTVVTVRHGDGVHGATVSAFASVSLSPALVVVSLNRRSRLCARLAGSAFGVNILASHQIDLARHFAGQPVWPAPEITWAPGAGAPRLAGCTAFLACVPWASYDGGDHVLYVGEVRQLELPGGEPLVVHGGAFRELGRATDDSAWIGSLDGPGVPLTGNRQEM